MLIFKLLFEITSIFASKGLRECIWQQTIRVGKGIGVYE